MEEYKRRFAEILARTGALFFAENLRLKDGRPTPYFVNMGKFRSGRLNFELGSLFADMLLQRELIQRVDVIVGPSYKGSAIANATVNALWIQRGLDVLFDYDRKEAKTHGDSSGMKNMFVNGCLEENRRLFIVDDVGTSMATKYELLEKIDAQAQSRGIELKIIGVGLAVDREQTSAVYDQDGAVELNKAGSDAIGQFQSDTGVPVYSLCAIRETIEYLYRERIPVLINGSYSPIDDDTKSTFEEYIRVYGAQRSAV